MLRRMVVVILIMALIFGALPARPTLATPAAQGGSLYTVQPGDNLFRLALQFGTTVQAIQQANALTSNLIYAGQVLVIPGATTSSAATTYRVRAGDNLFRLALRYGTTVQAIQQANGLQSSLIFAGQVLVIPVSTVLSGTSVRPAPVAAVATTLATLTAVPPTATTVPVTPTATSISGPTATATTVLITGQLTLVSQVPFASHFVFWGASSQTFDVPAGVRSDVQLPVGTYGWTMFANNCQVDPLANLVVHATSTATFTIQPAADDCGFRVVVG